MREFPTLIPGPLCVNMPRPVVAKQVACGTKEQKATAQAVGMVGKNRVEAIETLPQNETPSAGMNV